MVPVALLTALLTKSTGTVKLVPPVSLMSTVALRPPVFWRASIRGRSVWGRKKEILIGWIWLIVTSGLTVVVVPVTEMMLPGMTVMGPVLPSTGERIWVYSTLSAAICTLALSASTMPASAAIVAASSSTTCCDSAFSARSAWKRV